MFVSITSYVYNQLTYLLYRRNYIYQPDSTDVVITTPGALDKWSHNILDSLVTTSYFTLFTTSSPPSLVPSPASTLPTPALLTPLLFNLSFYKYHNIILGSSSLQADSFVTTKIVSIIWVRNQLFRD